MQSAKRHILILITLGGSAMLQCSCTPVFQGKETPSAATTGGKQVISQNGRPQSISNNRSSAATKRRAEVNDSSMAEESWVENSPGASSEKLTPIPADRIPSTPNLATTTSKPEMAETIPTTPLPEELMPEVQQVRPPNPSATMSKGTKPIEKMAKSYVPKSKLREIQPERLGPIVIADERSNRIVNANGRDVVIKSNNGVVVISGGCNRLTLSGDRNQIQCDSANDVELPGHGNTIVVGLLGTGNISGDSNTLSWGAGVRSGDPRLTSSGVDNVLERLE